MSNPSFDTVWQRWLAEDGNPGGLCKFEESFRLMFDEAMKVACTRTCDGCRHWLRELPEIQFGLILIHHHGYCQHATFRPSGETVGRVQDQPEIKTGPKFGCVHWEAKPSGGH